MNIEDYRDYCLSLGDGIEEKFPFIKFKNGEGVLVFYVCGHMFSYFDCDDFKVISLKCQPERIEELKAEYDCIGNPYNKSPKHWIGWAYWSRHIYYNRYVPAPKPVYDNLLKLLKGKDYFGITAYENMTGEKVNLQGQDVNLQPLNEPLAEPFIVTRGNKQLYIVPNATHCDIYDGGKGNYIPFDYLENFYKDNLK